MLGVTATATPATAASIHHQAVLRPDDGGAGVGYYLLCGERACDPKDAIGISVHPDGFFAKDLAEMQYHRVQFSIFSVTQ